MRGHRATLPGSLTEGNKSLGLIFKVYPPLRGGPVLLVACRKTGPTSKNLRMNL